MERKVRPGAGVDLKGVISYRLYLGPVGRSSWYYCIIFPTKSRLHSFRKEQRTRNPIFRGRKMGNEKCLAVTNGWDAIEHDAHGKEKKVPCCGQILFYQEAVTLEIVSHEMTHAALYWCVRSGIDPIRDKEGDETLARTQGWLLKQFGQHWWRHVEKREGFLG